MNISRLEAEKGNQARICVTINKVKHIFSDYKCPLGYYLATDKNGVEFTMKVIEDLDDFIVGSKLNLDLIVSNDSDETVLNVINHEVVWSYKSHLNRESIVKD